jgi:AcrR family transcriptional regulator
VETVAARAGVNKTTVYRNWPTRAALVRAAAEERSEGMIRTEVTGHPERDLTAFLQSVVASVTSPVGRALVIATLSEPETARSAANRAGFWRHRFDAAADLIRSVAGEEANADEVIEQLIAPVFLRAFITGAPIDRELIEKTVRAALRPPTHNTEVNDESARSR